MRVGASFLMTASLIVLRALLTIVGHRRLLRCGISIPVISRPHAVLRPCPLYPRKQTSSDTTGMSALCQKRTFASQQKRCYSITSSVTVLRCRGKLCYGSFLKIHPRVQSAAALHDNLVAAHRGRDLAFRGQHWLVIKVKVSVGHMRLPEIPAQRIAMP